MEKVNASQSLSFACLYLERSSFYDYNLEILIIQLKEGQHLKHSRSLSVAFEEHHCAFMSSRGKLSALLELGRKKMVHI